MRAIKLRRALRQDVWVFRKNPDSEEIHLFKAFRDIMSGEIYDEEKMACCDGIERDGRWLEDRVIVGEDEARFECAKIGRAVCAKCVGRFYTTLD